MKVLGLFLAIGETWQDFVDKGQAELILSEKISVYAKYFDEVVIYSYGNEFLNLLPQVKVVGNRFGLHRYLYAFLLPLLHFSSIRSLSIMRGLQITGGIPLIFAKIINGKNAVVNYGYDYARVSRTENHFVRSKIYYLLQYLVLPFMDHVIVTTQSLANQVKKINSKIDLIPNGVDVNKFNPGKFRKQVSKIMFVGRLEKQKNLPLLIKAVSLLQRNMHLVFVGKGSQEDSLKNLAREKNVHLSIVAPVAHDKLPELLKSADMFVLSSHIEGNPKALLEAMSCGLPVIGTNVEGIRDVIYHKQTGILVNLNPEELASWIQKLSSDSVLRKNIGIKARKFIIDHYNTHSLQKKEVQLLLTLSNE